VSTWREMSRHMRLVQLGGMSTLICLCYY